MVKSTYSRSFIKHRGFPTYFRRAEMRFLDPHIRIPAHLRQEFNRRLDWHQRARGQIGLPAEEPLILPPPVPRRRPRVAQEANAPQRNRPARVIAPPANNFIFNIPAPPIQAQPAAPENVIIHVPAADIPAVPLDGQQDLDYQLEINNFDDLAGQVLIQDDQGNLFLLIIDHN